MRKIAISQFEYVEYNVSAEPIIRWICESCHQKGFYKLGDKISEAEEEMLYIILSHRLRIAGYHVTKEHIVCPGCLDLIMKMGIQRVFLMLKNGVPVNEHPNVELRPFD